MKQIKYSPIQRLIASLLLTSLFLEGCHNDIVKHDIEPAAYISGKFEHHIEQIDQLTNTVLYSPPYRPARAPEQCSKIYEQVLQSGPYDQRQDTVLMKVISGKDGRSRIEDTTGWPYLFHGQLGLHFSDGKYGGSGILVGPQHILTAAHNVYDYKDKKGWAKRIEVRLALNKKLAPYGEAIARRIYTFKPWLDSGSSAYDMALLVLDRPIGLNTGWCGLLALSTQDLKTHKVNITGYPGDKKFNQMWTMSDSLKSVEEEQYIYEIDTAVGQSGSGIWINKWGSPYVVGIHTRGGNHMANIGNSGVRLSYGKAQQVIKWIDETLSSKELIQTNPSSLLSEVKVEALASGARDNNTNALLKLLKESIQINPSSLLSEVTVKELASQARDNNTNALVKLLEEADKNRNPYAQCILGNMYRNGEGVTKDYQKAAEWYEKAAVQGDAEAQNNLGDMYRNGFGVTKDYQKAAEWYEKAAGQGYAAAQNYLGFMYHNGEGVTQDYQKAVGWYQKAADQGYATAQHNFGFMYCNGYGVTQDYQKAVAWFEKAAGQGNAAAQNCLGSIYYFGEAGTKKDYQKASEWYQKAADQGNSNAQFYIGNMYQYGYGVEQDYQKTREWYQKAADQGQALSQNRLGYMYYNGWGVEQDYQKAREWYQKAADGWDVWAQYYLARMYQNGEGGTKDYQKAREWYQKAADRRNLDAQNNLGDMYYKGYGGTKDYQKAREWYQKAAGQGNAAAQNNLGDMYRYGYGVTKDYQKAREWYQKAADGWNKEAKENLVNLNSWCLIS